MKWFGSAAKKCIAVCCCISVLCTSGVTSALAADSTSDEEAKDKIAELNSQYQELEKKKQELQNQIASVQSQKKQQSQEKNELESEISVTTQQIELLDEKIAVLDDEIYSQELLIQETELEMEEKETEIAVKEEEISSNEELLRERIRRSYMEGTPTVLEVLLGSGSFFQMLTSSEMVTRMVSRDQELLETLAEEKLSLEDDYQQLEDMQQENQQLKEQLEETRQENEDAKVLQNEKAQELQGQVSQINSEIQSLEATEREYYANQEKIQAEMKAAQDEITRIYESLESVGEYTGGQFGWPLPGYSMITSAFGWRFNNTDFHTGIDISGSNVYGKTVVAANPGKVAFVNTSYSAGVGYGIYLIVDHGGGYSTLYAHLSAIDVSVGDVVARGTPIAKVGSTGWSTGPHLHFEVRIDGEAQNPMNYLGSNS